MFLSHGVNKYLSHDVDNFFFNLRFFSAYLVHIDTPNKAHEHNKRSDYYSILRSHKRPNTMKAFILEIIAQNIFLDVSISQQ